MKVWKCKTNGMIGSAHATVENLSDICQIHHRPKFEGKTCNSS
uniref:Uncharacterized protein n=1 Tax=Setaria italica TaxID=4555 RepID=K4A451_SETIT